MPSDTDQAALVQQLYTEFAKIPSGERALTLMIQACQSKPDARFDEDTEDAEPVVQRGRGGARVAKQALGAKVRAPRCRGGSTEGG